MSLMFTYYLSAVLMKKFTFLKAFDITRLSAFQLGYTLAVNLLWLSGELSLVHACNANANVRKYTCKIPERKCKRNRHKEPCATRVNRGNANKNTNARKKKQQHQQQNKQTNKQTNKKSIHTASIGSMPSTA